jgi:YfiH family protein
MSPIAAQTLDLPGEGRALFTARAHGNLSSVGGAHAERGLLAREQLCEALGMRRLVRGYQVHGTVVGRVHVRSQHGAHPGSGGERLNPVVVDDGTQPTSEADGHAIAVRGEAAMVLTADCLPVVLGAQGAVAALHAGWRGLAAGVLEEGVLALREVGGLGDIVAIVGPCAGGCCYEVGEEVHAAFHNAHRHNARIDLRAIAHERLLSAGVAEVRDVAACTICDERYFSHRREGARAGRQSGVAWIGG